MDPLDFLGAVLARPRLDPHHHPHHPEEAASATAAPSAKAAAAAAAAAAAFPTTAPFVATGAGVCMCVRARISKSDTAVVAPTLP